MDKNELFNFVYDSMFDDLKKRLDELKALEKEYQAADEKDDTAYTKSYHLILRSIERLLSIIQENTMYGKVDPEYFISRVDIVESNLEEIRSLLKTEVENKSKEK